MGFNSAFKRLNWFYTNLNPIWNISRERQVWFRKKKFYFSLHSDITKFKVCKSVRHYTIQISQPTRCNNFSSLLLDVYIRLNMFRPYHDQQHCYHHASTVNQRLLLQLLSSWWWVWGRPKHVQLYINVKQ